MIGRLLCWLGWHKFVGQSVPHTYECSRCGALEAGYP